MSEYMKLLRYKLNELDLIDYLFNTIGGIDETQIIIN